MVRQLAAQRALDDGFLEATHGGLELLRGERPLPDELVENLGRDRRQTARQASAGFRLRGIAVSSCYAPHTKFLTPSIEP